MLLFIENSVTNISVCKDELNCVCMCVHAHTCGGAEVYVELGVWYVHTCENQGLTFVSSLVTSLADFLKTVLLKSISPRHPPVSATRVLTFEVWTIITREQWGFSKFSLPWP